MKVVGQKYSYSLSKLLILIILVLISIPAFTQEQNQQNLEEEAKTNKRLLPKYGLISKSTDELDADKKFIDYMMGLPHC